MTKYRVVKHDPLDDDDRPHIAAEGFESYDQAALWASDWAYDNRDWDMKIEAYES